MRGTGRGGAPVGARLEAPGVVLYAARSPGYRVGFRAGRRLGKAVARSALKRAVREFWRARFRSGDFMFVLRPPLAGIRPEELAARLTRLSEKIPWCAS